MLTEAIGRTLGRDDVVPFLEIGRRRVDAELLADDLVEVLLVQDRGNLVDVVGIDGREYGAFFDVGEQRDLAALLARQRILAAAQQHVGLDTDGPQFLDGVLRRLGLDLARRGDVRDQRQVHVQHVVSTELEHQLADRLEERQRFDVADRAADLDHADVGIAGTPCGCSA